MNEANTNQVKKIKRKRRKREELSNPAPNLQATEHVSLVSTNVENQINNVNVKLEPGNSR